MLITMRANQTYRYNYPPVRNRTPKMCCEQVLPEFFSLNLSGKGSGGEPKLSEGTHLSCFFCVWLVLKTEISVTTIWPWSDTHYSKYSEMSGVASALGTAYHLASFTPMTLLLLSFPNSMPLFLACTSLSVCFLLLYFEWGLNSSSRKAPRFQKDFLFTSRETSFGNSLYHINDFPQELLLSVLQHLSFSDLANLSLVSRELYNISLDESLWRYLYSKCLRSPWISSQQNLSTRVGRSWRHETKLLIYVSTIYLEQILTLTPHS